MVGLFLMLSIVLWYVIDWFKRTLEPLPDGPRKLVILAASLIGGIALAIQFRLDVFAVAAQVMGLPEVSATLIGQVFAGLVLASRAGGAHELIKALQGQSAENIKLKTAESGGNVIDVDIDSFAETLARKTLEATQKKPPDAVDGSHTHRAATHEHTSI